MTKINALIVDDEENARLVLYNFIAEYCPNVNLVAQAEDVKSAVKIINNNAIDLVFLDVEMPNENGFALFDYFNKPSFETIFCTAYSQYAINAFEVSATDYLLKPLGLLKLQDAIDKVAIKMQAKHFNVDNIAVLKDNLANKKINKIGIHIGDGIVFMNLSDIYYFEANGSYCNIHHKNGVDMTVKKIKHFEDVLSADKRFFRIHRSYFVNLTLIRKYSKKDGLSIAYNDKIVLPVSREKKEEFEELMELQNLV